MKYLSWFKRYLCCAYCHEVITEKWLWNTEFPEHKVCPCFVKIGKFQGKKLKKYKNTAKKKISDTTKELAETLAQIKALLELTEFTVGPTLMKRAKALSNYKKTFNKEKR